MSLINLAQSFQFHLRIGHFYGPVTVFSILLIFPNKHSYSSYPGALTVLYWVWSEQITYVLVFKWLNQEEPHLSLMERTAHYPEIVSIEPDTLAE